ncbi:MAG: glutathione S-transferase family protein [Alphaproteobacteria bacterium]|nr:glutathione S-transferase family protein [Alphaproteobacteria bacterium]
MSLTLYHHNSSVCAAKVRVALAEKSLPWESRLLRLDGDQFEPGYRKLNPRSVVPTLVHDGRAIIESNIILEYLEDAFPQHSLRPDNAADRAAARLLLQNLDNDVSGIHHAASVATYAIAYRHHVIAKAGSTERAELSKAIDQTMNNKSRAWLEDVVYKGIHAPAFAAAIMRFDLLIADFEQRLSSSIWLIGDHHSIADVAYTSYMIRLDLLQLDALWRKRPAVADWYGRLRARDSARAVLDWYDPENIETLTSRGRETAETVEQILAGLETRHEH